MRFIVDASPLILLHKGGFSQILCEMAEEIVVPQAVFDEVSAHREDGVAGFVEGNAAFRVVPVKAVEPVASWDLGGGETSVISFAYSNRAHRPLLDDAEGKACCLAFGLRPLGTGSLLVLSKREGRVPSVRSALQELKRRGMWISDEVIELLASRGGE